MPCLIRQVPNQYLLNNVHSDNVVLFIKKKKTVFTLKSLLKARYIYIERVAKKTIASIYLREMPQQEPVASGAHLPILAGYQSATSSHLVTFKESHFFSLMTYANG